MAKIDTLKNQNNEIIYPKTTQKAIYDDNGISLEKKVNSGIYNQVLSSDTTGNIPVSDNTLYNANGQIIYPKTTIENVEGIGNFIETLSYSKVDTVHKLSGLNSSSDIISAVFTATESYISGDTITIDDIEYSIQLSNGETPSDNLFVAGCTIPVVIDTIGKKINFKAAGGDSSFPAGTYALCKGFRETEMWTVPSTGLYRLICIGRGGTGGNGVYTSGQSQPNAGGGGGGSGGWCAKTLTLTAGETYRMQVTISSSRIIKDSVLVMEATRGQNGGFGAAGTPGKGGAAGTASGGDENHNGFAGEDGGLAASGTGAVGGNGAATDWENLPQYLFSGYGVGAFQGENTTINGQSPYNPSCFSLAMGAGGGGGGARNSGGIGQSGSPGCIVVEYVLG